MAGTTVPSGRAFVNPITYDRARMWCFTLNADELEGEHITWPAATARAPPLSWNEHAVSCMQYFMYQVEKAPETGKIHCQGFVCFKNPVSFRTVKDIQPRAHWEKSKGSLAENIAYCSKEGSKICGPFDGKMMNYHISILTLLY